MTRTAVLNKQQIIRCAFDIAREKGRKAITIREIGNRLGKSTAPIYTQYSSIDDIIVDLKTYIKQLLHRSTMENRTNDNFLNMGVGFLAFVIENKRIFNDFFLKMGENKFDLKGDDCSQIESMKQSPFTSVLNDQQLQTIMLNMQIYSYGLATMICTSKDPNQDLNYYQKLLEQAGTSLIGYQLYNSGKIEDVIEKLMQQSANQSKDKEVTKLWNY